MCQAPKLGLGHAQRSCPWAGLATILTCRIKEMPSVMMGASTLRLQAGRRWSLCLCRAPPRTERVGHACRYHTAPSGLRPLPELAENGQPRQLSLGSHREQLQMPCQGATDRLMGYVRDGSFICFVFNDNSVKILNIKKENKTLSISPLCF